MRHLRNAPRPKPAPDTVGKNHHVSFKTFTWPKIRCWAEDPCPSTPYPPDCSHGAPSTTSLPAASLSFPSHPGKRRGAITAAKSVTGRTQVEKAPAEDPKDSMPALNGGRERGPAHPVPVEKALPASEPKEVGRPGTQQEAPTSPEYLSSRRRESGVGSTNRKHSQNLEMTQPGSPARSCSRQPLKSCERGGMQREERGAAVFKPQTAEQV